MHPHQMKRDKGRDLRVAGSAALLSAAAREQLISSAAALRTIDEFKQWTRIHIRSILPHEIYSCGFGHIHAGGVALDGVITVDYPTAHLDAIRNRAGGIETPILRRWLATREPQLFDPAQPWPDVPGVWLDSYRQHGLGRTAAHGIYDTERCIGTYHSFHCVSEALSEHHIGLLRELVPLMHEVALGVIERFNAANQFSARLSSLSEPERAVVDWLKVGKTNPEIAQLLGCSEGAVKQRLKRVFERFEVQNRAQLVRCIIEHQSHATPGYGTKYL